MKKNKSRQLELQFYLTPEMHELSERIDVLLFRTKKLGNEMTLKSAESRKEEKQFQKESMRARGESFQIMQRLLGMAGIKKDSMDIAMDSVVNIIQN
jgi:hypothetical protein